MLPAQAEELIKRLQDGLLPMLQNFRQDTVLPWCLATGETIDGYAELFQCQCVVKLPAEPCFASLPRVTVWLQSREVHIGHDLLPPPAAGEVLRAAAAIVPRLHGPHQFESF